MIHFSSVSARGRYAAGMPRALLRKVSLTWQQGVLAVIGSQADGTSLLLDVAAGVTRVREGQVLVMGQSPREARSLVAYVPRQPTLPDALRVDEVCELARAIRGALPISLFLMRCASMKFASSLERFAASRRL